MPIAGAPAGTLQLAEPRLGECSVVLTRVLGRPIRATIEAPPTTPAHDTTDDTLNHEATSRADDHPHAIAQDIPDDHPLVVEVRSAFNAQIIDKVAKQHRPAHD